MKSTGIVRKLDSLGRIVLPIELRRVMGIEIKDPIEVYVDGDKIVLGKYKPGCDICGEVADKYVPVKGKRVCLNCAGSIYRAMKP